MVNKLLIGVGILALVAVGSIGVWKLSGDDGRRVGALGPIEEPIALAWRGAWAEEAKYEAGQVVSYVKSSYVAEAPNSGQAPNAKEGPWALMAAQGLQGPQGPAGTFSGTFTSPDGGWRLSVTDTGIRAEKVGPSAFPRLILDAGGARVETPAARMSVGGGEVTLDTANGARLKLATNASISGGTLTLNCNSSTTGVPVVRHTDKVTVPATPHASVPVPVMATTSNVLAC